ncbi:hypothetical protein [Burkholderia lata]|uniref:hypothetical protein n=1 Tax=Burkholderia lata (strain ATCC 17760 / DSM 23089 / LMG 22485 / NCIMB 9086 / R18194 / 383) TaxID=482957 RepID=UPI00242BE043|nr:hypothetical protein [Burkholderia lata]
MNHIGADVLQVRIAAELLLRQQSNRFTPRKKKYRRPGAARSGQAVRTGRRQRKSDCIHNGAMIDDIDPLCSTHSRHTGAASWLKQ